MAKLRLSDIPGIKGMIIALWDKAGISDEELTAAELTKVEGQAMFFVAILKQDLKDLNEQQAANFMGAAYPEISKERYEQVVQLAFDSLKIKEYNKKFKEMYKLYKKFKKNS